MVTAISGRPFSTKSTTIRCDTAPGRSNSAHFFVFSDPVGRADAGCQSTTRYFRRTQGETLVIFIPRLSDDKKRKKQKKRIHLVIHCEIILPGLRKCILCLNSFVKVNGDIINYKHTFVYISSISANGQRFRGYSK